MRIIVSTDSQEYSEIAKKYGAEVPFLRPTDISKDKSIDIEFIEHALNWLEIIENYIPDIILQLRPTQPCRTVEDINECLDIFIKKRHEYDSLRSVIPIEKCPQKKATCLKVFVTSPKKPNSASRKVAKVLLISKSIFITK